MANSNQHRLVLSIFILCTVAIIGGSPLQQKCRKGVACKPTLDDGIWLLHFGPANSTLQYLDPLSGTVKGHYVDIVNAVCQRAYKDCRIVYDIASNCWDTIEGGGGQVGGFGLFNFYYDACVGWLPTFRRLLTFQFTESHGPQIMSGFIVNPGDQDTFDPSDLTGKTIGFIDGFYSDPSCLARQVGSITGANLPEENIVLYSDIGKLIDGVRSGEVAAGFDSSTGYETAGRPVVFLNDSAVDCTVGGSALMMRKDNLLKSWWDPALAEFLNSPEYVRICDDIGILHGDYPGPDGDDFCI